MQVLPEHERRSSIHEKILDSFPPPKFLNIAATGVDISDTSVKVMHLKQTKAGHIPDFFEERRMTPGIVHGGEIKDTESLVKVLTALRRKHNISFVRASLPEEKAYLFQTTVPHIEDRKQLRNNIEFQLEEHVPISPEQSIFDYDIIEVRPEGIEVSVTVFPKPVITNYQQAFREAGMTPVAFEIEGQAMANAIIPRGDVKTYMIVDFGRKRSGISIVKNGIVTFTSTVDVGGDELTEHIIEYLGVNESKSLKFKNKEGLLGLDEGNKELHDALIQSVTSLRDEVHRHFLYWNNRERDHGKDYQVGEIILCGGNASLAGLPEFLSSTVKVPVTRADVWQNAFSYEEYIPQMSRETALSYATVIGLALT
ncbi:MAG: pilus assembly protein PilM [Candidatus Pacebacteria bacterium]|nr:pilus assembly protein PilM [Candidatus Paceibacterota bacterium]